MTIGDDESKNDYLFIEICPCKYPHHVLSIIFCLFPDYAKCQIKSHQISEPHILLTHLRCDYDDYVR